MTNITCDLYCHRNKNGKCIATEVDWSSYEGCMNYSEVMESELPDRYYRLKEDRYYRLKEDTTEERSVERVWVEGKGNKIIISGREMFETFDRVTDGKTGLLMGRLDVQDVILKCTEEFVSKLDATQPVLSPLYDTDKNKYRVEAMKI